MSSIAYPNRKFNYFKYDVEKLSVFEYIKESKGLELSKILCLFLLIYFLNNTFDSRRWLYFLESPQMGTRPFAHFQLQSQENVAVLDPTYYNYILCLGECLLGRCSC